MDLTEKTKEENYLYRGKILSLRNDEVILPNGNISRREYVEHRGGCAVFVVDGEYTYLVSQYRYPYREVLQEIPAGKIESGEDPSLTAIRELEEEVGLITDKVTLMGVIYPTPGYTNEKLYIYLADSFTSSKQNLDSDEFLTVERVKITEVYNRIQKGEIKDGKTIYAITRYLLDNGKN